MSDVGPAHTRELVREIRRLHDRAQGLTSAAWRARCASGGTRAERMRELADELVDLGREAGSGVPPGVRAPHLADHALADQIVVLAGDVVEALLTETGSASVDGDAPVLQRRYDIAERARAALRATLTDLGTSRP